MFKAIIQCCAVLAIIGVCGCSQSSSNRVVAWSPKTQLLDDYAEQSPQKAAFVHDVKGFYEHLHNKDWSETYNQRIKEFHIDCSEQAYINFANKSIWELKDYEVLSVTSYDTNRVELICRFIEGPVDHTSYSNVVWIFEDGMWRCDCAGPTRLAIFLRIRVP
jgi:hypothetical protein